jgi:hypothetical protein
MCTKRPILRDFDELLSHAKVEGQLCLDHDIVGVALKFLFGFDQKLAAPDEIGAPLGNVVLI